MTVFFIMLLLPAIRERIPIKGELAEVRSQRSVKLFFWILFLLLALRHAVVGRDVNNYQYIFNKIINLGWNQLGSNNMEIGYTALNKAVSSISTNFQWLLIVVAAISIIPLGYQYAKHSEDPLLTISIFIVLPTFLMLFSGIRQAIAISIGMISYEFTKRKKLIPFIATVVVAMLFHLSAFMLAIMYPLYHVRITKNWLWAVMPAMLLVFIYRKDLFEFMSRFLRAYAGYFGESGDTGAYTMLILFLLFSVYSFVIPGDRELDDETIGLRNFLLLSTVIQMFAPVHSLAMRMNYYYIVFIPLLIPRIIKQSSIQMNRVAKLSRYVMIVFFVLYFFTGVRSDNSLDVFPYHFFWENVG